jgi:hypothetical protein
LAPLLQSWRRSGTGELVTLAPLDRGQIAEIISAILDGEQVDEEFHELMYARTEGNPFVVEEMLTEVIDRADVQRSGDGWQRRSFEPLRIPDTIRDTILLRFARLDPAEAEVLQLASDPGPAIMTNMIGTARSWTLRAKGELAPALAAIERQTGLRSTSAKVRWRTQVEGAEVLLELGRLKEAQAALPATSERAELQDLVYDAGPQIRLRLETGCVDEAVDLAREIASYAARLAPYHDALAVAVEALVTVSLIDEAHRRVAAWLNEHDLEATPEPLELKGFDGPQPAWRLRAGATSPART